MPSLVICQCGQQFEAADFLAGREVPCPACGHTLLVPAQEEEIVELNPAEPVTRISVACQCGKRFKALPIYLGKMLPCPACGNHLLVKPAPPVTSQLIPLPPLGLDSSPGNYGGGMGQPMPFDPMAAGYPGQTYGAPYTSPWATETPASRRGGSFELGPRAITALISCGVGAIVLMLLAIVVPQMIPQNKGGRGVASNSPPPAVVPKPANANPPVANTPAPAVPSAPAAPSPSSTASSSGSSSGSWWDFFFSPRKNWATFSNPLNPIAIDFPGVPLTGNKARAAFGATHGMENPATLVLSDGNEFGIASIRLPLEANDDTLRRAALNEILSSASRDPTMRITDRRDLMLGEHPGLQLQFTEMVNGQNYQGSMRVYVSRQFICLAIAIGPNGKFNTADGQRFLDSMRITSR